MASPGNLLSAEELDALNTGIGDGSIAVDTGYNSGARVRKHDLSNEDSSLGVNVSALDMINERFIRLFRLGLLEMLRTSPRINPSRVTLLKFGEYLDDKAAPLSVNVIRMNPLRGSSLVLIDTNLIFTVLDNFFGGSGRVVGPLSPTRLFTPTEARVIELILKVLFSSLQEAWAPLVPVEFERISSEINPQFAQIADENDLVLVSRFDADCGDAKGFIDVVYPYASLKPIRDQMRNRGQAIDENAESDRRWFEELAAAIGDARLEMQVILGQARTTLAELEQMKEGDVLFFRKFELARALINGIPAFDVQVGTSGPAMAVQIRKTIEVDASV
jgi:flagellar motor switch protein FliM